MRFFLLLVPALLTASCEAEDGRQEFVARDDLCQKIALIEEVPTKAGLRVDDEIYNEIMNNSAGVKLCVLDSVLDDTPMTDPRNEPVKATDFAVGDLAFFLLCDLGYIEFDEAVPGDVKEQLKSDGLYAYFDWVKRPGSRAELHERIKVRMND